MPYPRPLAPYATHAEDSRGRLFVEPESESRTVFQRDRDRIIHSAAFRRLKHKTQVFVYHEGDHYRSRLTHSLEVSQIARSIARTLAIDEDLAEALALAHDLGHPPFGHAGEDALNAAMRDYGGFDHNAHTLRIVTRLEQRYADFDGLNLSWETLEGIVKHNGPLTKPWPPAIAEYNWMHELELGTFAGIEAQVAALSDDIAYNNHDIDDGLRAGLFSVEDLADVPLAGPVFGEVRARYPDIGLRRLKHESIRRMIDSMVRDIVAQTSRRLAAMPDARAQDIRHAGAPTVAFSDEMAENDRALKTFLREHMYRHQQLDQRAALAAEVVSTLFRAYFENPGAMPDDWAARAQDASEQQLAWTVSDFVAGMTDRFALLEYERLTGKKALSP